MNKFQLMNSLPEPRPDIEIVREHMGEDGWQYNVYHVRAFNIEDQNYAPLSGMRDWVIDEFINMAHLGWTQADFDAEKAEEDRLYQQYEDNMGYNHF